VLSADIQQVLDPKCLEANQPYSMSAMVKLLNADGNDVVCNSRSTKLTERCSLVQIAETNSGGGPLLHPVAGATDDWVAGWNELKGVFNFFPAELNAGTTSLVIAEAPPPGVTMLVDNIKVSVLSFYDMNDLCKS